MQTPYGYSGYNAVPAQKPANVAMYAAGGAVAGAVVGAGAPLLKRKALKTLSCFWQYTIQGNARVLR